VVCFSVWPPETLVRFTVAVSIDCSPTLQELHKHYSLHISEDGSQHLSSGGQIVSSFGIAETSCFHSIDDCFLFGVELCTHVSSPVRLRSIEARLSSAHS
jgi:hypothetical protein